jgi:hypothetical protein
MIRKVKCRVKSSSGWHQVLLASGRAGMAVERMDPRCDHPHPHKHTRIHMWPQKLKNVFFRIIIINIAKRRPGLCVLFVRDARRQ